MDVAVVAVVSYYRCHVGCRPSEPFYYSSPPSNNPLVIAYQEKTKSAQSASEISAPYSRCSFGSRLKPPDDNL
jgi:hypothetical protein